MPDGRTIIIPDPKEPRPANIEEKRALVAKTYGWNRWKAVEHKAFCEMENLPLKALKDYSETEYDRFLEIFEKSKMVLFRD